MLNSKEKLLQNESEISTDPEKSSYFEYRNFKENAEDNNGENRKIPEFQKLSFSGTTITIIKTIIGIGIFDISYVLKILGFYYFIFFISIGFTFTLFSVNFLLKCKDITKRYSYSIYSRISLGFKGIFLVKFFMIFGSFFDCVIYFKIFGNIMKILILIFINKEEKKVFYLNEKFYIFLIFIILIPLIFRKNLSSFEKFSFFGFFSIITFIISVIIIFAFKITNNELKMSIFYQILLPNKKYNFFHKFAAVQSLFLSFSFTFNLFPLYLSLKKRSTKLMMKSTFFALIITTFIYFFTAIFGCLMYNEDLNDILIIYFKNDIIKYFQNNKIILSAILIICEITLFVNAVFSLPLLFFPLKNNMFNIILLVKNHFNNNENINNENIKIDNNINNNDNNEEIETSQNKNLITFLTYISVLIFALFMKKNLFIENIIGSTANNFISFIFPSFFLIKIDKKNEFKFLKILSFLTFFFGISTLIFFIYLQIFN